MSTQENWKTKYLIIGAILGMFSGVFAAYMLVQRAEQRNRTPQINAGDGVKVGLGLLGVMKLIADLGD